MISSIASSIFFRPDLIPAAIPEVSISPVSSTLEALSSNADTKSLKLTSPSSSTPELSPSKSALTIVSIAVLNLSAPEKLVRVIPLIESAKF